MKTIGAILTLGVLALSTPALAGGVPGEFLTQSGGAKVHLAPCGPEVCGTVTWLKTPNDPATGKPQLDAKNPDPALRSRPALGLELIKGMKPVAQGKWAGGKIYDPQTGKTYDSKLTLNPDGTLKVEGCISIICQGQTWTPVG